MKRLLFCLIFFPVLVSAQINESDTLRVKASLTTTGVFQAGNVDTWIFRARTDLSFRPLKNWVFKNQNSYVYQAFGKVKADEDILSLNFLYFKPYKKVYPFVLGFVSTNFRREIDLRSLVGAGVTFQVFNKKEYWLKLSVSSEYEQTDFSKTNFNFSEYDGSESINTFRGTIWVNGKYKLFKNKIVVNHESYFQPSLEDATNYRWQANVGLDFPIVKYLNFNVNYRHTFESIVIQDQKQQDQFLTFGFSLKSF